MVWTRCFGPLLVLLSLLPSVATATTQEDPLERWLNQIDDIMVEVLAPYQRVPPTPVPVRWQAQEIWSGQLSAEVVDMQAVDLGGDGKSELVALTGEELVVFSKARGLFDIRMRATLPLGKAMVRSRDPIGSLSVVQSKDGPLLLRARTSEQAAGASYSMVDGQLSMVAEFAHYPLCHEGSIPASLGRNYLLGKRASLPAGEKVSLPEALYSVRCTHGAVDPSGRPVEYLSFVSVTGDFAMHCRGEAEHCQSFAREVEDVGDTHLVADIDNDGYPEIVVSGRGTPGVADRISVLRHQDEGKAPLFVKSFEGGVVAMSAGDFAGDGALELVVAVRKRGEGKVTLWLLN